MTMRYMKHAPEAYLDQDAAAIVARMTAVVDPETAARGGGGSARAQTGMMPKRTAPIIVPSGRRAATSLNPAGL
jgi:hypothetical protein